MEEIIVDRILALIKQKGMTVSGVEKELEFGKGAIKRFASSSPSIDKIAIISNFLNVSIDYLVYGDVTTIASSTNGIQITDGREQELLHNFRQLSDSEKDQLIGRVQLMTEMAAKARRAG